jgi:hypothetical protein
MSNAIEGDLKNEAHPCARNSIRRVDQFER